MVMETPIVVLVAASVGLIVNTLAVLAVAWKGGHLLGRLEQAVGTLATEVAGLRTWRHDQAGLEQKVIFLQEQVTTLEDRLHGHESRGRTP